MKQLLILMILFLSLPVLLQAQDDTTCDLNVVEAITALVEVQRAADTGDNFAAVQALETVQKQIEAQLAACEGVGATLGRAFESADGLFNFSYPAEWAFANPFDGTYVMAASQELLNAFLANDFDRILMNGAEFIIIVVVDLDEDDDLGDTFEAAVEEIEGEGLMPGMGLRRQAEALTVGEHPAVALDIVSSAAEGKVYVLDIAAENAVIAVVAFAPRGEFAPLEPFLEAVAESLRYGEVPAPAPLGPSLDELTYTSAVNIADLIDDVNFRNAKLSPDGTKIVWQFPEGDGIMCVYTLDNGETSCQPIPELFGSTPPLLLWSPDSRYVAFTQNFFLFFHEPDIWVFDNEAETITNLTNDNINRWRLGAGVGEGDSEGPMWIDHTMTWGPDNQLYFVRLTLTDPATLDTGTSAIHRLNPETGDTELIRALPAAVERMSVYGGREHNLDGAMSISPDGSTLAFLVLHPDRESPGNGVWTIPLDSEEDATHWVHLLDFNTGLLSDDQREGVHLFPNGVAWSADMQSLFIMGSNPQFQFVPSVLYELDLTTGDLSPLTDFSDYTRQELLEVDEDGVSAMFDVPRGAVMSPDSTTPIIFHAMPQDERGGISAVRLVDGIPERTLLYKFDDYQVVPTIMSSASRDGKLLLWGYLFQPEGE